GFVLAEIGARGVAQAGTAQVPAAVVGHPAVAGGRGGPGEALGRALGDRIEQIGRNDEVGTHDSSVPCATANLKGSTFVAETEAAPTQTQRNSCKSVFASVSL